MCCNLLISNKSTADFAFIAFMENQKIFCIFMHVNLQDLVNFYSCKQFYLYGKFTEKFLCWSKILVFSSRIIHIRQKINECRLRHLLLFNSYSLLLKKNCAQFTQPILAMTQCVTPEPGSSSRIQLNALDIDWNRFSFYQPLHH